MHHLAISFRVKTDDRQVQKLGLRLPAPHNLPDCPKWNVVGVNHTVFYASGIEFV